MKKFLVVAFPIFCLLFSAPIAFAKTDLSISESDISFSKNDMVGGETVRIYARVFNVGDIDALGSVIFLANAKEISAPQSVSLKPNTYDDVYVDWKPVADTFTIEVKIVGVNPKEDDVDNNSTLKKDVLVSPDNNHNGIPDAKEQSAAAKDANVAEDSKETETPGKYQAVYEQIQKGIEGFYESAPVQSALQYINNATGGKIPEAYKAVTSKLNLAAAESSNIDYKKPADGIWEFAKKYWYWFAAGLAVLVLLWLFKAWRNRE